MNENIRKKTKIGIIWSFLEKISTQIVSFVLNIILARLLMPEDYGLIGLLTVFITLATVFTDGGFSKALVQKQDRTDEDYSTIFLINFIVSTLIYIFLFFISPLISKFYDRPELIPLSRVLFIVIIVSSLSLVHRTMLQVNIDFKSLALINFVSSAISGILSILLAYMGGGIWALVFQNLSYNLLVFIMLLIKVRWLPKYFFNVQSFRALFGFGWKILITNFIYTIIGNITDLFIGKKYSPKDLGLYTRAQQFPSVINRTVSSVLETSTFPLLSALQNDIENTKSIFSKFIKYVNMLMLPCMFGLFILSKEIVLLLLSEKWVEVIPYLQLASIAWIFEPLIQMNNSLVLARGRSDIYMKYNFIKIPLLIIWLLITLPLGVYALLVGRIIFSIVSYFIHCIYACKYLDFGFFKQIVCSWKYYISSLVMCFVIFILKSVFSMNLIVKTPLLILIGAISYILALVILQDKEFLQTLHNLSFKRNKSLY